MGLPITSVLFWYTFEAGRVTVCVWPLARWSRFSISSFQFSYGVAQNICLVFGIFLRLGGWLCVWPLAIWLRFLFSSFLLSYGVAQNICLVLLNFWGWEDDCVCVTSGHMIEVFVLFFSIIIWGCLKHLFGFDIFLRLGGWLCVGPLARLLRFLFSPFLS